MSTAVFRSTLIPLLLIGFQSPVSDPAPRPPENPLPTAPAPVRPALPPEDPPRRTLPDDTARAADVLGAQAGTQDPGAPATDPSSVPVASEPAAVAWRGGPPATPEELDALLATLASAYPDRLRVQSLGRSRAGRNVWVATVTSASAEDAARVPALLATPPVHLGGRDGLEPLLQACIGLLERSAQDPHLAARLATAAVHFLLTPDPERAWPVEALAGPAADFPAGWTGSAGRAHPLSEPATRAVAEFLLRQPSIGLAVRADPAAGTAFHLVAEERLAGGSFERFAREYLGLAVAVFPPAAGTDDERRAAEVERCAALLGMLPRVELANAAVERVRPDLWILECDLANRGSVATLEGAAITRERASVWAELTEGTLVAATRATAAPGVFEPIAARANAFDLGHLAGGATLRLRLVVRGGEGTRARLAVGSLRAGTAAVALELR